MELKLSTIKLSDEINKKYIIYGTGEIGRMLNRTLKLLGQEVVLFLCSDGYKKEETIDGIEVKELSDFVDKKESYDIILTVQRGAEFIIKSIKEKIDNNIIEVNLFDDVLSVYSFFYKNYFFSVGVDIDSEYIDIEGVKFINPFKADSKYALAFFMECGDLILPALYDDLSCIHEGPYEKEGFKIEKEDVVLDCGSNMGLFSFVVADRCKKVYAFEPVKSTQNYIKKMLDIYSNVSICDYALADEVGTAEFSTDLDTNFSNHIVKDGTVQNSITVNVTTIDKFVEENNIEKVDFIKADIEGAERYMLKGAFNTLRKFAPKLSICEYHLPDDPKVLENIILEANPNYIVKHKHMKIYAYVPQ